MSEEDIKDGYQREIDEDRDVIKHTLPDAVIDIANLASDGVKAAILNVPPHFFDYDEDEIMDRVKPSSVESALRVSFWNEYERCLNRKLTRMKMKNIYRGVCSGHTFNATMKIPIKCAFLLKPVPHYNKYMESLLHIGLRNLTEIITMDIKDKGKVCPKKGELFRKTWEMIDNRMKGMAVQRAQLQAHMVQTEVKNDIVAVPNINAKDVNDKIDTIRDEIKELPEVVDLD